jgi:hypothetical protein
MNLPHDNEQAKSSSPNPVAKKPYEKPAFRFERVFETQALNCGKTASQGQCHSSSRTS